MRGHVLVVDDDADLREAITDALRDEGYTVGTAADGLLGLDYLRANSRPGLILLDWMMPRCDGPEFRARQRQDPAIADIPVVLITADPRLGDKRGEIDVAEYLPKPVPLARLLAVVRRFCG